MISEWLWLAGSYARLFIIIIIIIIIIITSFEFFTPSLVDRLSLEYEW